MAFTAHHTHHTPCYGEYVSMSVQVFVSLSVTSGDPLYHSDNCRLCCCNLLKDHLQQERPGRGHSRSVHVAGLGIRYI